MLVQPLSYEEYCDLALLVTHDTEQPLDTKWLVKIVSSKGEFIFVPAGEFFYSLIELKIKSEPEMISVAIGMSPSYGFFITYDTIHG